MSTEFDAAPDGPEGQGAGTESQPVGAERIGTAGAHPQADGLTAQAHQALDRGETEAANRLFDEAIAARDGQIGQAEPTDPELAPAAGDGLDLDLRLAQIEVLEGAALDSRFAEMSDGRLASQLRAEWGADAGRNLAAAQLAFTSFFQELHNRSPAVAAAVRDLAEDAAHDLGNNPSVIAAFAALGRRAASRSRVARPRKPAQEAAGLSGESGGGSTPGGQADGERRLNDLTEQAWAAMGEGRRDKASALFAERDALAARLFGTQPPDGRL